MAIYIGNDSKAVKVKSLYVGVDGKARKVKKGYIGVDGVARQFYVREPQIVSFTSNPVPTTGWTLSEDGLTATAINKYGKWTILSDKVAYEGYLLYNAFDNDKDTYFRTGELYSDDCLKIKLIPPSNVQIKPSQIYIKYKNTLATSSVKAIAENGTEDSLFSLSKNSSIKEHTEDIYQETFYESFLIQAYRYSSASSMITLFEFSINSGKLKIL